MTFDEAYTQYYQQINKYIFKHLRDPDITEDLTQETFMKAWRAWSRLQQDSVQSWLHTIALNTVRDYTRKHRACSLDKLIERGMEFPDSHEFEKQQCEASDMIRRMLNSELGDQVRYLLDDDQCENGEELARKYNIKIGAAKNRTHRARAKVRQRFGMEVA